LFHDEQGEKGSLISPDAVGSALRTRIRGKRHGRKKRPWDRIELSSFMTHSSTDGRRELLSFGERKRRGTPHSSHHPIRGLLETLFFTHIKTLEGKGGR